MLSLGLLGKTLSHSLSVPIHEAYFARIGEDDCYGLIELAPGHVPFLRDIMQAHGLDGLNVTIPYKQLVCSLMDELTPEAQAVGAVNTVLRKDDRLIGHNTDVYGFRALLHAHDIDARGMSCALLGATGGAARAAVQALRMEGARKLWLVSRSAPDGRADADCEWIDYEALAQVPFDLLINCTPVGMFPNVDASPVSPELAARASALVDMIYNPAETLFLSYARAAGRKAVGGLYMLVAQAVAAEAFWRGSPIDEGAQRAIYEQMRGTI